MGMDNKNPLNSLSETVIQTIRELIHDDSFRKRHRTGPKHFTRRCRLLFERVVVFMLQKSMRAVQQHLHSFFEALGPDSQSVKASTWCDARLKLSHTAFIELNERAVLDVVYQKDSGFDVQRWMGHRLIGIDSSLVRLPDREALGEEFGWVENSNQKGSCGKYPQARLSALTDVLNRIVIQTFFVPWKQGERALAVEHINALEPSDISIMDRGYASYELFAQFIARERLFVCRCAKNSFGIVNRLFKEDRDGRSVTVKLRPGSEKRAEVRRAGLPEKITVRFVTVRLSTGELEVLATNLLDEQRYLTEQFSELYYYRWDIETYYGLIKGRLDLENFSGLSAEAVRQDMHSTVLLSNLESILIQPAQEQLSKKSETFKNPQQVNHAVSFHTIKSQMVELILSREPLAKVLPKLQRLFLDSPVSNRPWRKPPRQKKSGWRSYNYQRNTRKIVF